MLLKKKSLPYRFLLLLATMADFGEAFDDYFRYSGSGICSFWPKEFRNFRTSLSRLFSAGNIEKIIKNGESFLIITSSGLNLLKSRIPLLRFRDQKWDGKWLMVVFDIPEEGKTERDWLRRKMKDLGFARLQKSIYISPFKLGEECSEFFKAKKLENYVMALETSCVFGKSDKGIAQDLWELDYLNNDYDEFASRWKEFLTTAPNDKFCKRVRDWRNEWYTLVAKDPCLPMVLLPSRWKYGAARQVLLKLEERLGEVLHSTTRSRNVM